MSRVVNLQGWWAVPTLQLSGQRPPYNSSYNRAPINETVGNNNRCSLQRRVRPNTYGMNRYVIIKDFFADDLSIKNRQIFSDLNCPLNSSSRLLSLSALVYF